MKTIRTLQFSFAICCAFGSTLPHVAFAEMSQIQSLACAQSLQQLKNLPKIFGQLSQLDKAANESHNKFETLQNIRKKSLTSDANLSNAGQKERSAEEDLRSQYCDSCARIKGIITSSIDSACPDQGVQENLRELRAAKLTQHDDVCVNKAPYKTLCAAKNR